MCAPCKTTGFRKKSRRESLENLRARRKLSHTFNPDPIYVKTKTRELIKEGPATQDIVFNAAQEPQLAWNPLRN
jgi:hypothetical protein